jgi:hypothetical protein
MQQAIGFMTFSIVFTLATMVKIEYGHLPVNAFNHGNPYAGL